MPSQQPSVKIKILKSFLLWLIGTVVAIIIVIVTLLSTLGSTGKDTQPEILRMTHYLHDKYGKDFVVGKATNKAAALGDPGYWESDAYAKNDPSLHFNVDTSSGGTSDQYAAKTWQRDETTRLKALITQHFGNIESYNIEIHTPIGLDTSPNGNIISLTEAAKQFGHNIFYKLQVFNTLPNTKGHELAIGQQLLDLRPSLPLGSIDLEVDYFAYVEKAAPYTNYYGISVQDDRLQAAKSPNDLHSLFKTWRIGK